MRRRGSDTGDAPGQLHIQWEKAGEEAALKPTSSLPVSPVLEVTAQPLVQRLRWDFVKSFPEPTPEAIEAGVIQAEHNTHEHIAAIHDEHAREALSVLHDIDAIADARRRGVDPSTRKPARTPAARNRLAQRLESEPKRLEHWYQALMDTYEEAFGADARNAFDKALRARHAGIAVIVETEARQTDQVKSMAESVTRRRVRRNIHRTEARRIVARFPCPAPLASAVAAGDFGQDENGRNIRPTQQEVREITEHHVDKLLDILDSISHAPKVPSTESACLKESYAAGIAAYAESFGPHASRQLDAYVRRQLERRDQSFGASPRSR